MTKFVLAGVLMLVSAVASAQTHPCDVASQTTYREPSAQVGNLKAGFCHDGLDAEGNLIGEALGFVMTVEGGPTVDLGVLQPLTGPNAAGERFYETPTGVFSRGGTVRVIAYTATLGQSVPSESVLLTLLGPPKAPRNLRISR